MDDVRWFLHWRRCAVTSVSALNVVSLDSETYKLKRLLVLLLYHLTHPVNLRVEQEH